MRSDWSVYSTDRAIPVSLWRNPDVSQPSGMVNGECDDRVNQTASKGSVIDRVMSWATYRAMQWSNTPHWPSKSLLMP